jgi:plasmid stabilization system protein ParE
MNYKLIFSPKAEETYDALTYQLRQRWGDHFVNKFETKVQKSLKTIVENPYIYPIAEENTEVRKCILHKKLFNAL